MLQNKNEGLNKKQAKASTKSTEGLRHKTQTETASLKTVVFVDGFCCCLGHASKTQGNAAAETKRRPHIKKEGFKQNKESLQQQQGRIIWLMVGNLRLGILWLYVVWRERKYLWHE